MKTRTLNASQKMKKTSVGDIPVDWELVRLPEILNDTKGKNPKTLVEQKEVGYLPYVSTKYLRENVISNYARVSDEIVLVDDGDLILLWDGSNAGEFFCAKRGILSSTMARMDIRAIEKYDRGFVYYALKAREPYLQRTVKGTGIPHVDANALHSLSIPVPALIEQRKIAEILLSVDSVIEKTQAVIEQIQILKRGLMQELFTRGIPGRHKKFKKTSIGEIPEDWEVVRLRALSTNGIHNGIFRKRHQYSKGILLVNVLDTYKSLRVDLSALDRVEATNKEVSKFGLTKHDLLFVRSSLKYEGIGQCCVVYEMREPMLYECHLMRIRPNQNRVVPMFLAHYCRSRMFKHSLFSNAKIQTMTTLAQDDIGSILIPLPKIQEQEQIAEVFENCDRDMEENRLAKEMMQDLKHALMQVLLTGEVRVKA